MIYAVILSGGRGKRMNSDIPKQYMDLCGKPVLYYAINEFNKSKVDNIIIVAGENDIESVKSDIVDRYGFNKVTKIVPGGKERYNSVHNALNAIEDAEYVLIHDGARPFFCVDQINNMIDCLKKGVSACIAAVPVKDTIKSVNGNFEVDKTIPREKLWQIQTPQAFDYNKIKCAYDEVLSGMTYKDITDDAMIWEMCYPQEKIRVFESSYNNIKITTKEDMTFGRAIIENKEK